MPDVEWLLAGIVTIALTAWACESNVTVVTAALAGYALTGVALGADAAREALAPSLRAALHEAFGGFVLDEPGPAGAHAPVVVRARLTDDAAPRDFGASARAEVVSLSLRGLTRTVEGGVRLGISGAAAGSRVPGWRAGRVIEAPVTFRRPTRYFNDGIPDFERDLSLGGVALFGSVKSGLLVDVVERGSPIEEAAADFRASVRASVTRWVGAHHPIAAAIVTAILIGDRTALPDDVRDRLQVAGTYHVIAISGGNIAILAALMAGVLMVAGVRGRISALVIMTGLLVYASVISAGPSVWRATTTAIVYLAARLVDHRSPPWNAMAVSASILACADPLEVRDVGFVLTFGATAAILEAARRVRGRYTVVVRWALASVAASLAVELVLLPVGATVFSRVTAAGVVLNLLAVPLMTATEVAGLAVVSLSRFEWLAGAAAAVAAAGATGLVESARLVDLFPWLVVRVPAPAPAVVIGYYLALGCTLWLRRARLVSALALLGCGAAILGGPTSVQAPAPGDRLRLTMFDVGQGEALLLQTPAGGAVMVDAGGAAFEGTAFDIGGRVLAPALWAHGVRQLDALAITHGDPDHIGGARAIVRDFTPRQIWKGIPVPRHAPSRELLSAVRAAGIDVLRHHAGSRIGDGDLRIRVLHPPTPDWERQRVRNDDSLVLEVRHGEVAILLTGDVSAEVERALLSALSPARIRILKVAHHGSRTSTSQELLDAWKPQIALISCGRGNRFGHPAPEVLRRLEAAGVRVYRTDRDGQITLGTDGKDVSVRTYVATTKITRQ